MKPAEVREIYIEACRYKRRSPETGESREWEKAFCFNGAADLRDALSQWWSDRTPGADGQPRSVWFPQISQLKPMVDSVRRAREIRNAETRTLTVWRCESCGVTCSAYILPGDDTRRYCQGVPKKPVYERGEICGGSMRAIHREMGGDAA